MGKSVSALIRIKGGKWFFFLRVFPERSTAAAAYSPRPVRGFFFGTLYAFHNNQEKNMNVAIPFFNQRVSPRFEYAPALLLARVEDNKVVEKRELSLAKHDFFRRCALIKELGVDTLICGGINGFTIRLLDWRNVQVVSPIAGEVEEVLQRFLEGKLDLSFPQFCAGRRRRRYRGGKRRNFGSNKGGKRP